MNRVLRVFPVLLVAALVLPGTREGDRKPREIKGWDTVDDPAGDCRIAETDGAVTITVPGTHHNLNPTPEFNNMLAPRVLRAVEGDFTLQVTVGAFARPKPKTSSNGRNSFVGAGLLVYEDGHNFIRFLRCANGDSGGLFTAYEVYHDGELVLSAGVRLTDKPTPAAGGVEGQHVHLRRQRGWEEVGGPA